MTLHCCSTRWRAALDAVGSDCGRQHAVNYRDEGIDVGIEPSFIRSAMHSSIWMELDQQPTTSDLTVNVGVSDEIDVERLSMIFQLLGSGG